MMMLKTFFYPIVGVLILVALPFFDPDLGFAFLAMPILIAGVFVTGGIISGHLTWPAFERLVVLPAGKIFWKLGAFNSATNETGANKWRAYLYRARARGLID